jgi:hypothetical protein
MRPSRYRCVVQRSKKVCGGSFAEEWARDMRNCGKTSEGKIDAIEYNSSGMLRGYIVVAMENRHPVAPFLIFISIPIDRWTLRSPEGPDQPGPCLFPINVLPLPNPPPNFNFSDELQNAKLRIGTAIAGPGRRGGNLRDECSNCAGWQRRQHAAALRLEIFPNATLQNSNRQISTSCAYFMLHQLNLSNLH